MAGRASDAILVQVDQKAIDDLEEQGQIIVHHVGTQTELVISLEEFRDPEEDAVETDKPVRGVS